jgi:hypothetical protein
MCLRLGDSAVPGSACPSRKGYVLLFSSERGRSESHPNIGQAEPGTAESPRRRHIGLAADARPVSFPCKDLGVPRSKRTRLAFWSGGRSPTPESVSRKRRFQPSSSRSRSRTYPFRDGQAEPGTAESPRRRHIGLAADARPVSFPCKPSPCGSSGSKRTRLAFWSGGRSPTPESVSRKRRFQPVACPP